MKQKRTLRKAFKGLLAAVGLVVLSVPSVVMAAPAAPPAPQTVQPNNHVGSFDALEIFPQEEHILTPRSTGTVIDDATDATPVAHEAAGGSVVLFVIGGKVTSVDADGEWTIGSQNLVVYESAQTVLTGAPSVGDEVTVVAKRTLEPGPIVAQYITMIDPAPQTDAPAVVTTAYLFNGTVTLASPTVWRVAGAAAGEENFNILAGPGPAGSGPTAIHPGLTSDSPVTVEYLISEAPVPQGELAFDALEIFPQEEHVLTPKAAAPVANTMPFSASLPESTTIHFVIGGAVTSANQTSGEWQIGSIYVYESTDTVVTGTSIALGDVVTVVGKRTVAAGPIVAQYITLIDADQPDTPTVVSTAYLFNGTVTVAGGAAWEITPPPPAAAAVFNIRDNTAAGGPTVIYPGLTAGSAVTVEYVVSDLVIVNTPVVQTQNASNINDTAVTLSGSLVSLGASASVKVYFEYGTSNTYGSVTPKLDMTAPGTFDAGIVGLTPGTTYHFRAVGEGAVQFGNHLGADMVLTTSAPGGGQVAPSVATVDATGVTTASATLNGTLSDLGTAGSVSVSFDWGTTAGFGNTTPAQTMTTTGQFSAPISGLAPGSTYYFRATASGDGETIASAQAFTTTTSTGGTGGDSGSGGGSGSSGSGGGQSGSSKVSLTGMTADKDLMSDSSGKSQETVRLSSSGSGKKYHLDIPAGTIMKDASGSRLASLTFTDPAVKPGPPQGKNLIIVEDVGPNGASFNPPITLTFEFDPAALPAGVSKNDVAIAFWDGHMWLILDSTVDAATNMVSARVNHFTVFGVLVSAGSGAPPTSAAPTSRPTTGPTTTAAPTQVPTSLPPETGGLTTAPTSVPTTSPAPASSQTNWVIILGVIAAASVVVSLVIFMMKRRTTSG